MTEKIELVDGRIHVGRIEGKPDVDVDPADVHAIQFERGVRGGDGALVLVTEHEEVVIRVSNEDAGEALATVREALPKTKAEKPSSDESAPRRRKN